MHESLTATAATNNHACKPLCTANHYHVLSDEEKTQNVKKLSRFDEKKHQ